MLMMTCRKCGATLPEDMFHLDSRFKAKRRPRCKPCVNEYQRTQRREYQRNYQRDYANKIKRQDRAKHLVDIARRRALNKGWEFNIEPADISDAFALGCCELTGLDFDLDAIKAWNSPSLDRIDASRGYVKGNVRVILWAANVMAHSWGSDMILKIADAMRAHRNAKIFD